MKIKKGDTVKIISGKDRGKSGKVLKIFSKSGKLTVDGINLYKKHVRPKRQGEKGEIVTLVRPLNASNAMLLCPQCKKTTRIGCRFEANNKVRYCKKCQSTI